MYYTRVLGETENPGKVFRDVPARPGPAWRRLCRPEHGAHSSRDGRGGDGMGWDGRGRTRIQPWTVQLRDTGTSGEAKASNKFAAVPGKEGGSSGGEITPSWLLTLPDHCSFKQEPQDWILLCLPWSGHRLLCLWPSHSVGLVSGCLLLLEPEELILAKDL